MKLILVVVVSALALSAAGSQSEQKPAPAPKAAPNAAASTPPAGIPADAVKGADGLYHYTDPQGKKWVYGKTPFGISRGEDTGKHAAGKSAASIAAGIKATEDGDKVRFERLGPFGVSKWEKKTTDLDEVEKAALENSRAAGKTASQQD